jgi:hypothetical protein
MRNAWRRDPTRLNLVPSSSRAVRKPPENSQRDRITLDLLVVGDCDEMDR